MSNPIREMKVNVGGIRLRCTIDRSWMYLYERSEYERICWDPKDGELCLNRVKSEETLMEARSGSDVQIDRRIWV